MTASVSLTLPYPPGSNEYWVPAPGRGLVPSATAIAYKEALAILLSAQRQLHGPVTIRRLHIHPPRSTCDIDAPFKCLFDALSGFLWSDDNQVKRILDIRMCDPSVADPRVELLVEAERFATPGEAAAHARRKSLARNKAKATRRANRESNVEGAASGPAPTETTQQRLSRLARPAYQPPRRT